ncbi:T9SS type A sorting domain-containing protein [Polaribacter haliotis]|uniref:T9SS type A sorting domain-containing protein n=1 Tax=Polaribacter haliotis TaxID=1888915 RepID=A0A7L8AI97_9FLAO|nr:T9SS type A sorting domain-containing protein [Polaribacter haliotis]QOD61723.1 T9SS type A sorting domain-containing protein [Polaribacter haliotis]
MKKTIHKFSFCLILFFCFQINGQTLDYKNEASKENSNFFEIVKKTRKQFSNKKKSTNKAASRLEKKYRKQFERWVYIWKDRVNPDGTFPKNQVNKEEYLNVLLSKSNAQAKSTSASTTKPWVQIGPTAIVNKNGNLDYPGPGRVDVVAVDPNNSNIMYVGTPSGGLWKTINGGTSWTPKTDDLAGMGVTDILIDPTTTSTLYMATGDRDSSYISSIGLFKSTDAGETWTLLEETDVASKFSFSLSDNEYIRDIAFGRNPNGTINPSTIFALTNDQIRRSTDSGANWSNMAVDYGGFTYSAKFQSIVFDPNDGNKVVVSDFFGGLYYSTNGGDNFKVHPAFPGGNNQAILRITATPADNDYFYGINQAGIFEKYRFAFTDTSVDLDASKTIVGFNSQDGYIQCIAVSSTNANNLMVGGVQGWRSNDNGLTFSNALNAYDNPPFSAGQIHVHADHHFLLYTDDNHVINGNDAGLRMGLAVPNSDADFPDKSSGLIITQVYNIAITQGLNGDDYMMANQDNDGFSKIEKDGTRQWVAAVAGDGTGTAIDINDPEIRYLGGTSGQLSRTDDGYASGYASAIKILKEDKTNAAFISPIALHPTDPNIVYVGHGDVKKTTNKGGTTDLEEYPMDPNSFTALSSSLTQTSFLDVSLNSSSVRIFAIGELGGNITLRRSIDDGANWTTITNIDANPSAMPVELGLTFNSVYAVPNTDVVYATVSSYTDAKKIYKSIDNGNTWTNISGNMPNIIMKKIILDPNKSNETIYVATELGLYFTDDTTTPTSTNWTKLGTGLPNVIVTDIKVSKNNGNVYIGTFGRGMWVYNDQKYFDNTIPANVFWSDTSSWEGETLPTITDDVFIKAAEEVYIDSNGAVAKSIEIADTGLLYIEKNADLTIEENFDSTSANSVTNIYSDTGESGVLIVKGTSTGKVTYARGGILSGIPMAEKWNLISSPVIGQTVKSFATNAGNEIRTKGTSPVKYAIGKYNDANVIAETKWEYFDENVDAAVVFEKGIGYTISRDMNGPVSFTGTLQTSSFNVDAAHDKWVAVGNPFTAYYPANKVGSGNFIQENDAKLADGTIRVWQDSQNKYVTYTNLPSTLITKILAPGQGFFIKMKATGTDEMVTFNNEKRGTKTSFTGDNTFNKSSNTTPFIKIYVSKGNLKVNTDVIFSENATIGFDENQDIVNFGYSEFDLTTRLLDNSSDKFYTIQSIPKDNYENQIIALNLVGKENEVITFSSFNNNLPDGLKVFLEDKETSNFYELSETEKHTLTLSKNASGFGRFSIRFSRKALSVNDTNIADIKIYNQNNFLQIKGIDSGSIKIDLFDINGKMLFNQKQSVDKFSPIDLNSFSKGVYLVKVTSEKKSATKKIIIN